MGALLVVTVGLSRAGCAQGGFRSHSSRTATSAVSNTLTTGYANPVTITQGGTYTGRWQSTNPDVPAVTINTDDPVTIQNSVVAGPGKLIWGNGGALGIHLHVTNVLGTGVNPNIAGLAKGDFLTISNGKSIQVDHSTMVGLNGGIVIVTSNLSYLEISNNQALNMDDRASDGQGGMLTTRPAYGHTILLSDVVAPQGADISWNQLINEPGQASVEDMMSIYDSQGGSANLPINVHDNYLQGAVSTIGAGYTGGGILTDGAGSGTEAVSAFVNINNNQMVQTQNYGFGIAAGHDVVVQNNRVVSTGMTASGTWLSALGFGDPAAFYLWNFYNNGSFYNNQIVNNFGALVAPDIYGSGVRSDLLVAYSSGLANSTVLANSSSLPLLDPTVPSLGDELAEYTTWISKQLLAGQTVGAAATLLP